MPGNSDIETKTRSSQLLSSAASSSFVVAIRSAQTPYTLLDPLILFSVAFFFYFVIHVFWLETGHAALGIPGSARPYADALPRSQLYATGAYVTMVVGYCASASRDSRRGATTAALETVSPMPLIAIFIFGATANYAGMRLSTDADTTNAFLFRTLGYCALVAFIVTLIRHALSAGSSRRVFGYLAYGFMLPVLIILAFSVARGSRLDAAFVILALFSVRAFFRSPSTTVNHWCPRRRGGVRSDAHARVIPGASSDRRGDIRRRSRRPGPGSWCAELDRVGACQSQNQWRGVSCVSSRIFPAVTALSAWSFIESRGIYFRAAHHLARQAVQQPHRGLLKGVRWTEFRARRGSNLSRQQYRATST